MFNFAAFLYYETKHRMRIERRQLRDTLDPFDIPDERFREMYRLPRHLALEFFYELEDVMDNTQPEIPLYTQFCAVLNFYGSGSYQRRIGSDAFCAISQSCISKAVHSISKAISEQLSDRYIRFPTTLEDFERKRDGFAQKTNLPGVFAIVDGSQIHLAGLDHEIEANFVNRRGITAINTQVVGDADYRFLNVNARYPGSTHDSFIWRSSIVSSFLEEKRAILNSDDNFFVVLGDSGYPLQPWLIKPYDDPATEIELAFNIEHKRVRSHIERQIGIFKQRFRCLNKERRLHYQPFISAHIIYACAVLHNFLIDNNYPIEEIPTDNNGSSENEDDDGGDDDNDDSGGYDDSQDTDESNLFEEGERVRNLMAGILSN